VSTLSTTTTFKEVSSSNPHRNVISHFTNDQIAGKLMSMGVLPGSRITPIRKAPLGGGWYVRIDRQVIALRKEELDCIVTRTW
jgi:Fe2+ transport system protein FeoA